MSLIQTVDTGKCVVTSKPSILVAHGIGSCVALCLYNKSEGLGGLAHIALPECQYGHHASVNDIYKAHPEDPARCAEDALLATLEQFSDLSIEKDTLVAKIAGGANMFTAYEDPDATIGARNIAAIKTLLAEHHIPLVGADVGGTIARTVTFMLSDGSVRIETKEGERYL